MAKGDIAFWLSGSFIFGILAANLHWPLLWVLVGATAIIAIVHMPLKIPKPVALLMLAALTLGSIYCYLYQNIRSASVRIPHNPTVEFTALVAQEPKPTPKALLLTLSLQGPFSGTISTLTDRATDIRYGDVLALTGKLDETQSPPFLLFPHVRLIARNHGSWIKERLLGLKSALVEQFDRVLPMRSAALLAGLTFGETKDFTPDFKNAMKLSGTTHLTALSGYNIVILVESIRRIFGKFMSRRKTFFLTTIIIALFVVMVGAEASVVRAAIMGFLLLLAGESGRRYDTRNAVAFAALIMLLIDPTLFRTSIGFELSFLSLLGIAYLAPVLREQFGVAKDMDAGFLGWKENLLMTASAQLAVIPVLMSAFGEFSLTAIIANVLILEFVPIAMFFGFLLAGLGSVIPLTGFVIAPFLLLILSYMQAVIGVFAGLRLPIIGMPGPIIIATYYAILAAIAFLRYPRAIRHAP